MAVTWPASADELREAGYHAVARRGCETCGAEVVWVRTPSGGHVALEEVRNDPDPQVRHYRSHFTSCFAASVRRRKR